MGGVEGADRLIQEIKAMSKMSKIDQIHLRAVMLCMSKTSKILKQAITDYIELILFNVEDVEDIKTSHNRFPTDFHEFLDYCSTYIALQSLGVFDLPSTSSTYIVFKALKSLKICRISSTPSTIIK